MTARGRVTIRDVAAAAGVSTTTVSDSLSGRGRIPESTRQRVTEVAARLGYAAHAGAQNLRRGRSGALALYFPPHTFRFRYYMDLALGAAEEALEHALALTLLPSVRNAGKPMNILADGVIVCDPEPDDPMLPQIRALQVPIVACRPEMPAVAPFAGVVKSDHAEAAGELFDHLRTEGAESIGLISLALDIEFTHEIQRAYLRHCAKTSAEPAMSEIPCPSSPSSIAAATRQLLDSRRLDALVSVGAGSMPYALEAIRGEGIQVPDDLLVAACIDSPELATLDVPVTAVDLAPREVGRRVTQLLSGILDGTTRSGTVETIPTVLRVRRSSCRGRGTP